MSRDRKHREGLLVSDVVTSSLMPPDTIYVMHPDVLRRLKVSADFGTGSDLTAWTYRLRDTVVSMTYAFSGLVDGVKRATKPTRDLDWRMNWYRDPGAAWWEA